MIFEVAAAQCGGEAALKTAVENNRVKICKRNGIEFYVFPSFETGHRQEKEEEERIDKGKAISNDDYKQLSDLVQQMGWEIQPMNPQLANGEFKTSPTAGIPGKQNKAWSSCVTDPCTNV